MAFPPLTPAPVFAWSMMRCIFAFEICLIHICSPVWGTPQQGWMAETVFMSITRTGTVGFMMLAGAILIARTSGTVSGYLSYRLRRWLPMLLIAQLIYFSLGFWIGSETFDDFGWFAVFEPAWYHLWFFYALGAIYIMVIMMRVYAAWAARLSGRRQYAALWLPVVAMLAGLSWSTLINGGGWGDLRPLNLVIYFGYAWTGYVLMVAFPRGAPSGWCMLIAGGSAAALATALASEAAGVPVPNYFHRCTLFIAVAAMGQFLLLLQANKVAWRPVTIHRVNRLARLTLGIFVIHPLVIAVLRWPYDWALVESIEWISLPIAAVVLFGISGTLSWISLRLSDRVRLVPVRST